MQVYRCQLELMDYLFFATTERGKTFETGAFIHNYALTYALAQAGMIALPQRPPYFHLEQRPNYESELRPLNKTGIYVTPAHPLRLSFRQTQFNTIREGYALGGKTRSIGYPDWGFLRMISPGSKFEFYVLASYDLPQRSYLRLGKFLSKARLTWSVAKAVRLVRRGKFQYRGILNWRDIEEKPNMFDLLVASLPSRLIYNASFEAAEYVEANFGDGSTIQLPIRMTYLP